jgi:hypothetical protein
MLLAYKTNNPISVKYEEIEAFETLKHGIAVYTRDEKGIKHFQFSVFHDQVDWIEILHKGKTVYAYNLSEEEGDTNGSN